MSQLTETVLLSADDLKNALRKYNAEWTFDRNVLHSMVHYIGTPDSELRDKLIYSSFYRMIVVHNQIEPDMLKELVDVCLNELLVKGIGESGTDSVFTRSFTTLLIALILHRDNEDNFLTRNEVHEIKDRLIVYMNAEKDLRGYVPVKGWAHSVAHAADAFDELVKNPKIGQDLYPDILKPLWDKIYASSTVYSDDEDERLLFPILAMVERGLDIHVLEQLVQEMPERLLSYKERVKPENYWLLFANCKSFLKSFFLKINGEAKYSAFQQVIIETIAKLR